MSVILGVAVPDFPDCDKDEPCHLFCCNFLLHRRYGGSSLYYGLSMEQTPLEKLVETIHALHLRRQPVGTPVLPGDLIVIFENNGRSRMIRHSMIALAGDIWFGASNYPFFSRIFKHLKKDTFTPRDAVSTWMLRPDIGSHTFRQFGFDVWRE